MDIIADESPKRNTRICSLHYTYRKGTLSEDIVTSVLPCFGEL